MKLKYIKRAQLFLFVDLISYKMERHYLFNTLRQAIQLSRKAIPFCKCLLMQNKKMSEHVRKDVKGTHFIFSKFISYEMKCAFLGLDL